MTNADSDSPGFQSSASTRLRVAKPGDVSAIVQIDTGRIPDALVIPVEAMAMVDGRQSCYVVGADGLQRRTITTRRATPDLLEVTGGLNEGERVVLRPLDLDGVPVDDRTRDPANGFATDRTTSPARPS